MSIASNRGAPGQRPPKKVKSFGSQRSSLKATRRLGDRRRELAGGYSQDKFWDAVERQHGPACWLAPILGSPCAGDPVAMHCYPKFVLMELFKQGAILLGDVAEPYAGEVEIEAGASIVTLTEILLDPDNGLPGCEGHHDAAGNTWSGVTFEQFPSCVHSFGRRYQLNWLELIEWKRSVA